MEVELKYAGVPFLGWIAVHYWFVTNDGVRRDRFEVWQNANDGGQSVGHLHRNLMRPDSHVGGGPTHHAYTWTDDDAVQISRALQDSWNSYPYHHLYRFIPGPNSNTYIAWILDKAGIEFRLSWKAVGQNYLKWTKPPQT